ncbi:hypothetical protein PAPYR_6421 [Paratrimastix pyriformis]|uniref:Uncharacterized protein n=1 Tax=Paratrimastix pyriformis TaxID=342808 RepID=A0ABQ8UMB6_9EUKA|nr:hypothetical protein PAPYR_6421 [Paratrimastix pyriformis]
MIQKDSVVLVTLLGVLALAGMLAGIMNTNAPRGSSSVAFSRPPPPPPIPLLKPGDLDRALRIVGGEPPASMVPLTHFDESDLLRGGFNSSTVTVYHLPQYDNNVTHPLLQPHMSPDDYAKWPIDFQPVAEWKYTAWLAVFHGGISPDIDGPYTSTHYFRTRVGCTEAYFHDHPEIVASPGILRGYTFDSPVVLMRTLWIEGYFHWVLENVPRLMMVRETLLAHPEMRIIISYWDRPFFREYLDLLGLFPQAVLIPDSVHVLAPQIIVPAPVPCGQNVPRLLLEMRDVIYAAMAQRGVLQETQPQPQREIVVIRRGQTARHQPRRGDGGPEGAVRRYVPRGRVHLALADRHDQYVPPSPCDCGAARGGPDQHPLHPAGNACRRIHERRPQCLLCLPGGQPRAALLWISGPRGQPRELDDGRCGQSHRVDRAGSSRDRGQVIVFLLCLLGIFQTIHRISSRFEIFLPEPPPSSPVSSISHPSLC